MRGPTLWAAMSLASQKTSGIKPTVLISIAQNIDSFAKSCLEILEAWDAEEIPDYFDADPNDTPPRVLRTGLLCFDGGCASRR
jgi:hypothetical protein